MSFLTLQKLSKSYDGVDAVAGVDLAIAAGSRTAIVGPSGSGKSTLLRLIAGFEAPDAGTITIDGDVLADGANFVAAHKRNIGIVSQDGSLFPHLSIGDNIGFGLDRHMAGRAGRIADLIAMVGLDIAMLKRKPDQLSGGQQQRVALARSLACRPRLMLLDEPFSALDTGLRASTRKAVAELLTAEAVTSILVTHDQAEALSFADQIAVMSCGRFLQVDSPQALYRAPVDAMVAQFMGEAIIVPAIVTNDIAVSALGRVPVHKGHNGGVSLMVRPEQIGLLPTGNGAVANAVEIIEVDFSGTLSIVRLALPAGPSGEPAQVVSLSRLGMQTLRAGERVTLAIAGEAHVFKAPTD